jgi:hypothetical protein
MKEAGTWAVVLGAEAEAAFPTLPAANRVVIQTWVEIVEKRTPYVLQYRPLRKLWIDHPLNRRWAGRRASRFSLKGRIIYRIDESAQRVVIEAFDPDHRYGGKE